MTRIALVGLLAVLAGCSSAGPPDVALGGAGTEGPSVSPSTGAPAPDPGRFSWRHLATTEGTLKASAAAVAIESPADLTTAWTNYDLPGSPPAVDFERNFVLLLGQPDDACIDTLIGLEVRSGRLDVAWLPPPGGCNLPLIFRIHAVEVDRRHVPSRFEVSFPEPYTTDAQTVTIEVATVDGPAPPAPAPPQSMSQAEVAAVFEGHAVRRCTQADDRLSGETSVGSAGEEQRASALLDDVRHYLRDEGYRADVDFVPYISRADGVRPGVWVDGGAADQVRQLLDDQFGRGAVVVEDNGYDFEAVDQAQQDLHALMGGTGPGSIVSSTGIPGPVQLGMIDPTRKALDRVAATVDPALVCVYPDLSGVAAD